MRYLFRHAWPGWDRVLVVESGPREVSERLLRQLRDNMRPQLVDVFTCYPGEPAGLTGPYAVYRASDFRGRRGELAALLRERRYCVTAVLCADTAILPKWRWWVAWKASPSKVMVVNENADWIWVDAFHAGGLLRFALYRLGFNGGDAAGTIGRILGFPFALLYLLAFAAWVHLRRALRMLMRRSRS